MLSYPALEVVYSELRWVRLTAPYVPSFLAFREAAPLLDLLARLRARAPDLWPQALLVDGNGVLHARGCGLACHIGVEAGVPTVGVGKNLSYVDGLTRERVAAAAAAAAAGTGSAAVAGVSAVRLIGDSGREWGAALLTTDGATKPVFVSVGHRVSLGTALALVKAVSVYRVPEPVRQADLMSRAFVRESVPDV